MQINIENFCKLILSFWVCVARHAQSIQNKKFTYLCNSPKKRQEWSQFFACKIFYNLIVSLWMCLAYHSQSTQNNKFAISLQYLKENVKGEINYFPVDKQQRFFKLILSFYVCGQACPNYPKWQVCYFFEISQEGSREKLIFCMQISMKVSFKLIQWFLMGMDKHFQNSQNRKFAMSLQYLVKGVRDEVDFLLADKHQSFLQVNFNTLTIKVS